MTSLGRDVGALFARQDGVATLRQLERLGVTRAHVRSRVASGEWDRISRAVIASNATPETWRRRVRAAWLDAGPDTGVSHSTGARLQDMDGFGRDEDIHLTTCDGRHRTSLPGVVLHRARTLRPRHCTTIDGIRVVSRPVVLVQLAATHGAMSAGKALDGMLRTGDPPLWIERTAREWLRPGVPGATIVLQLLHERIDARLPRSWFQRVAKGVLGARRIALVDEHPVADPDTGRTLAELDLAIPSLRIGIECQSWQWHGTPSARAADARRKRRLRLLGWEIVDVWWTDLRRVDEVVAEIRYLIDRRVSGNLP